MSDETKKFFKRLIPVGLGYTAAAWALAAFLGISFSLATFYLAISALLSVVLLQHVQMRNTKRSWARRNRAIASIDEERAQEHRKRP